MYIFGCLQTPDDAPKTQVQKAKIPALDDSTVPLVEPTLPDPDPVIDADPESPAVPQHGLLLETAVPRFSTEEKTKSGDMLLGGASFGDVWCVFFGKLEVRVSQEK